MRAPLPLDYEGFYLGHQEFFHAFAEIHLGSRRAAEDVVHQVFLEILAGWEQLLQEDGLEQQTLTVLHRHVTRRLEYEGRTPAFVINGPIAQNLCAVRKELEIRYGLRPAAVGSAPGCFPQLLPAPARMVPLI
ncbi:hypothetical protein [Streptomyces sp. NBC_01481]|uniref:hypothetical protein n=1 Tax=Streptomyces sp. NBC_01481 TaxID=2975869 RepID=UPI00224CBB29|nr:hypothetical protein [Streptomyces sp. NBC_01481]MCX4586228.1 hypothetical protein [Streptomyces sp. NBC_01481]